MQRALQQREEEFVFLPNFADYQASHGDIGYVAKIVNHRLMPGANPSELPRADVQLRFDHRCIVHFHWIESNTGGLTECICAPIDNSIPALEEVWPRIAPGVLQEAIAKKVNGESLFSSAPHQHPELPHFVLHATTAAHAERTLAGIEADLAGVRGLIYPVITPPIDRTVPVTKLIRRLAALWLRHQPTVSAGVGAAAGGEGADAAEAADGDAADGSEGSEGGGSPPSTSGGGGSSGGSGMSEDARTAALFRRLSLKELRSRLHELRISLSASCLEKEDLISLLTSAARRERIGATAASAAEVVARAIGGMRLPIACGCPSSGMVIRACSFARQPDGVRLSLSRPDSLWGSQHDFLIDEHSAANNVGQVSVAVYDWERRTLGFGRRRPGGAAMHQEVYIPQHNEGDAAAALGHACMLHLASEIDMYASALLTPNLARVWCTDADAAVARIARLVHWPRVRLLFIGQRGSPEGEGGGGEEGAASVLARGGSLFSLLDRELIWLVADSLIAIEAADNAAEDGPMAIAIA